MGDNKVPHSADTARTVPHWPTRPPGVTMEISIPLVIVTTITAFVGLMSLIAGRSRPLSDTEAEQLR